MKDRKKSSRYEVLAVVVIAIVVFSLLRAAARQVRAVSVRSACVDNIHKIGTALEMYAKDWGGFAPPYTNTTRKKYLLGPGEPPRVLSIGDYASGVYLKRCLAPYGAAHVWHCPMDPFLKRRRFRAYSPIDHAVSSYYVDARLAIWRPVNIYSPPVVPVSRWKQEMDQYGLPISWAATDDVTKGGPYYLECTAPSHGAGLGRVVLKLDGSIVYLPKRSVFNTGESEANWDGLH